MTPLDLLDQSKRCSACMQFRVLALEAAPFARESTTGSQEVQPLQKSPGRLPGALSVHDISDPLVKNILSEPSYRQIMEEIECYDVATGIDLAEVHAGRTTPVFFGSASNNFGVEHLLRGFLEYSKEPLPRKAGDTVIPLEGPPFSAFVFKIQTNMNPQHRDRMVFARVCSGRFVRDMTAWNTRNGREVRISNSHNLFGRERETADEAYAGDIIGFVTNADFRIGDTISSDPGLRYNEIPRFAPECFAYIQSVSSSGYKSFRKGLDHLLAEDIVQSFFLKNHASNLPLLGAVGPLQFEVLQYRLRDEYGVESNLEMKPWSVTRWLGDARGTDNPDISLPQSCVQGADDRGRPVFLFPDIWSMQYFRATIRLSSTIRRRIQPSRTKRAGGTGTAPLALNRHRPALFRRAVQNGEISRSRSMISGSTEIV